MTNRQEPQKDGGHSPISARARPGARATGSSAPQRPTSSATARGTTISSPASRSRPGWPAPRQVDRRRRVDDSDISQARPRASGRRNLRGRRRPSREPRPAGTGRAHDGSLSAGDQARAYQGRVHPEREPDPIVRLSPSEETSPKAAAQGPWACRTATSRSPRLPARAARRGAAASASAFIIGAIRQLRTTALHRGPPRHGSRHAEACRRARGWRRSSLGALPPAGFPESR